jgi:RNA polymerase sigma factor (TIGR02999 family)
VTIAIPALVASAERGDALAASALFTTLYSELHALARRELSRRGGACRLGTTTLLHETYLDIAGREPGFVDRTRFMAYAARVMRGLIIDSSRSRCAQKRGGLLELTRLGPDLANADTDHRQLGRISDALDELATVEPRLAEIVDLKFFCGFSCAEIAAMHAVSEKTVQRAWEKARLYLHRALSGDKPAGLA